MPYLHGILGVGRVQQGILPPRRLALHGCQQQVRPVNRRQKSDQEGIHGTVSQLVRNRSVTMKGGLSQESFQK